MKTTRSRIRALFGVLSSFLLTVAGSAQSPAVDSVEAAPFFAAGDVTITGANFDALTTVALDGVPATIVSQTSTELVIDAASSAPGFADVTVANTFGTTTVPDGLERWPSLRAASTGLGGLLTIEVDQGDVGAYWVVASVSALAQPIPLPGVEFGLLLDLAAPFASLELGAFAVPGPALVVRSVPTDPELVGLQLFVQSYHSIGVTPSTALSFSNLDAVAIAPGVPGGLTYSENPATYFFGEAIPPNVPSVSGGVESYSVSTELPDGLVLDPVTGILTGSPFEIVSGSSAGTGFTGYTVTASNPLGSTTTELLLAVRFPMDVANCSLGCSEQSGQVTCSVQAVHVNERIEVEFTAPVSSSSVSSATFQVQETLSGIMPPGIFTFDPANPNLVVYEPLLSFDSLGNPVFGLQQGLTYQIFLPGSETDPGPHIESTDGEPLRTRVLCNVTANLGVEDPVPGPPTVVTTVDVVTGYEPSTGAPTSFAFDVPANGATNVHASSPIVLAFDDVMNPSTLLNPITGESSTVSVELDADGDLLTTADRVPWPGTFVLAVDQPSKETRLTYTPDQDYPPAGGGPLAARIVVELAPGIVDLAGNPLVAPGPVSFVPES